jgi:hypothetical protein
VTTAENTGDGTIDNPDPCKSRPDTHPEAFGRDTPTQVVRDAPDILTIDAGQAFAQLSDDFSPEFRQHMQDFRWHLNLRELRSMIAIWDHRDCL